MDHVSYSYILPGPWRFFSPGNKTAKKGNTQISKRALLAFIFILFNFFWAGDACGKSCDQHGIPDLSEEPAETWPRWWLLTVGSKVGIVLIARCYTRGSENGFSSRNLWLWLINHGVPRNEIERQPIKVCLDLFNQSYSRSGEQRPHWSQSAREFWVHRPSITQGRGGSYLREKILL